MSRPDGRGNDALRPVASELGFQEWAAGSILFSMGKTRVLCAASVSDDPPRWLRGTGKGWVTAEYSMLPASTNERSFREVNKGRPGGRTQEIQRLIGRALRSVTDLRAMGERMITIDCDVLQADAGTRTASITGGYVALALALRGLELEHVLRDSVAAVSVGIIEGEARLDLCYEEDAGAEVDFNVVMTGEGALVEVQGTAEGTPFSRADLDAMLDLATAGIGELTDVQRTPAGIVTLPERIALATRNAHKLRELTRICAAWPVAWVTVEDHDPADFPDVEETGDTYLENATLKARAVAAALGLPALADDSGIEVDALGGRPGPRSARFAGERATDAQNLQALVQSIRGVPGSGRSARYRCVAALAAPDGEVVHTEARLRGNASHHPNGHGRLRLRPDLRARGLGGHDGRADR